MTIKQPIQTHFTQFAATTALIGAVLLSFAPEAVAQSAGGSIWGFNVEWSPDGQTLAFAADWDGDLEIYTMDLEGGNITQLTHNDTRDMIPAFARDGKSVLYSANVDGGFQINRVSAQGGASEVVIADAGARLFWPEEGPDSRIIFVASLIDQPGVAEIRVLDQTSGEVSTLVADGMRSDTPTWMPDASGFLFANNRTGQLQIYAADLDGSNQRVLTSLADGPARFFGSAKPNVTPDGQTVIYWGDEGGNFQHDHHHNALSLETGEVTVLPKRILAMAYPDASPDGTKIAYVAGLGGSRPFSVYVMDLDGGNHRTIWSAR